MTDPDKVRDTRHTHDANGVYANCPACGTMPDPRPDLDAAEVWQCDTWFGDWCCQKDARHDGPHRYTTARLTARELSGRTVTYVPE